jgi:filamentous hemagglutinin family protein
MRTNITPADPHAQRRIARRKQMILAGCALPVMALLNPVSQAQAQIVVPPPPPALKGSFTVPVGAANRVTTVAGSVTTDRVTISVPKTIINWTPTDTDPNTALGAINFLGAGNQAIFQGTQPFTVLNRIIPVGPAASANARAIGLNGRVEGNIVNPDGTIAGKGNVWFYSPNGIIAGPTSVFNVGGLILTTLDPLDSVTGTFQDINGATGFFGYGALVSDSYVSVKAGASITTSTYTALLSPLVEQGGSIFSNSGAVLAAGEGVNITFNPAGLFDVSISAGTGHANGIVHTGSTTGPARDGGQFNNGQIVMAAIPKNDAITMLLSGDIGFAASNATATNGAVILLSGSKLAAGTLSDASGGFKSDISFLPSATGTEISSTSIISAQGNVSVSDATQGNVTFRQEAFLFSDRLISLTARDGQSILFEQGASLISRLGNIGGGIAFSAIDDPNVAGTPGSITVTGNLNLNAAALPSAIGSSNGGTISFNLEGGTINVSNTLSIDVSATGRSGLVSNNLALAGGGSIPVIGNGTAGTVLINLGNGTFSAGSITATANGQGGTLAGQNGGTGTGGTINITKTGTAIANLSNLTLSALGTGGAGGGNVAGQGGAGGTGRAGTISVRTLGGELNVTTASLNARGIGGVGGTGITTGGAGGIGIGGGATFKIGADPTIGTLTIDTSGLGGAGGTGASGGAGGSGTGGSGLSGARLDLTTDVLNVTTALTVRSDGTGGVGGTATAGQGGAGGAGNAGLAAINITGATTELRPAALSVSADGSGGAGGISTSVGPTAFAGADGGAARGGTAQIATLTDGKVIVTGDVSVRATATGGNASAGSIAGAGNTGGAGGNGGLGYGGAASIGGGGGNGFSSTGVNINLSVAAQGGQGGDGGETISITRTGAGGNGGEARAGSVIAALSHSNALGRVTVLATASGGNGGASDVTPGNGGAATIAPESTASLTYDAGINTTTQLTVSTEATGGSGLIGGAATSAPSELAVSGTATSLTAGNTIVRSSASGGAGVSALPTGGSGGEATSASAVVTITGADFSSTNGFLVTSDARGGHGGSGATGTTAARDGGHGGAGGAASAGESRLVLDGATVTANITDFLVSAVARGGQGGGGGSGIISGGVGIGGNGGNGGAATSGTAALESVGATLTITQLILNEIGLDAASYAGSGGMPGDGANLSASDGNGGTAGNAIAGNATLSANGGSLTLPRFFARANALGGESLGIPAGGGHGGNGTAGIVTLTLGNGASATTGDLLLSADGRGADGINPALASVTPPAGFRGGTGAGGTVAVDLTGATTSLTASSLSASARATGGQGSVGLIGAGGNGGAATAGQIGLTLTGASLSTGALSANVSAIGGSGGSGRVTGTGSGAGTGGNATAGGFTYTQTSGRFLSDSATPATFGITADVSGGNGGDGGIGLAGANGSEARGGTIAVAISDGVFGTLANPVDSFNFTSNVTGGNGGSSLQEDLSFVSPRPIILSNGPAGLAGAATGSTYDVRITGGSVAMTGTITLRDIVTGGRGGSSSVAGAAGGDATGGTLALSIGTNTGINAFEVASQATGGVGGAGATSGAGGNGQGGNVNMGLTGKTLAFSVDALVNLSAVGIGGAGGTLAPSATLATSGGAGGNGLGGTANLNVAVDPAFSTISINTSGTGGAGGAGSTGGAGGAGIGGGGAGAPGTGALIDHSGGLLTIGAATLVSDGTGGAGGASSAAAGARGGNGRGGQARVQTSNVGTTLDINGGGVAARGIGGAGGTGALGFGAGRGGDAFGGTIRIAASGNSSLDFEATTDFSATALGGAGATGAAGNATQPDGDQGGQGGDATGGSVTLLASNAAMTLSGVTASARAVGGAGGAGGQGAQGADHATSAAVGANGSNGSAAGAAGTPGPAGTDGSTGKTGGKGGTGGTGGAAAGGTLNVTSLTGTMVAGDLVLVANGLSGAGGIGGAGGRGGTGQTGGNGGTGGNGAAIGLFGGNGGRGGDAGNGGAGGQGGDGGDGGLAGATSGGIISVTATGGSITTTSVTAQANGLAPAFAAAGALGAAGLGGAAGNPGSGGAGGVAVFFGAAGQPGSAASPGAVGSEGRAGSAGLLAGGSGGAVNLVAEKDAGGNFGALDLSAVIVDSNGASGSSPTARSGGINIANRNGDSTAPAVRFTTLTARSRGDTGNNPGTGITFDANNATILIPTGATLSAAEDITINATGAGRVGGTGQFTLTAGNNLVINHIGRSETDPTISGGNIALRATNNFIANPGSLVRATGTLSITSDNGALTADALQSVNAMTLRARRAVTLNGAVSTTNATGAAITIDSGYDLVSVTPDYYNHDTSLGAAISATGDLFVNAGGNFNALAGASLTSGATTRIASGNNVSAVDGVNFSSGADIVIRPATLNPRDLPPAQIGSIILGNGALTALNGTIDLEAHAISAPTARFNANALLFNILNAPAPGVAGSDDGGLLTDPNCVEGNLCLGALVAAGDISISGGNQVHLGSSVTAGSIAITARDRLSAQAGTALNATGGLFLSATEGNLDLNGGANAGPQLTGGSIALFGRDNIIGAGARLSAELVNLGGTNITLQSILTSNAIGSIDSAGTVVNGGALEIGGDLTVGRIVGTLGDTNASFTINAQNIGVDFAAGGDMVFTGANLVRLDASSAGTLVMRGRSFTSTGSLVNRDGADIEADSISYNTIRPVFLTSGTGGGSIILNALAGDITGGDIVSRSPTAGRIAATATGAITVGNLSGQFIEVAANGAATTGKVTGTAATPSFVRGGAGVTVSEVDVGGPVELSSTGGNVFVTTLTRSTEATIDAANAVTLGTANFGGALRATGNTLTAGSIDNGGLFSTSLTARTGAMGLAAVNAGALDISAVGGPLTYSSLQVQGTVGVSARSAAGGNIVSAAGGLTLGLTDTSTLGSVRALNALTATLGGDVSYDEFASGGVLSITGGALTGNRGSAGLGRLSGDDGVAVRATSIIAGPVSSLRGLVSLIATGPITVGALSAAHDISLDSGGILTLDTLTAGDDVRVLGVGDVTLGLVTTTTGGTDNEGDGHNIEISGGALSLAGANSAGSARFSSTGLIQIVSPITIQGDLVARGSAVTLANVTAGGSLSLTSFGGNLSTGNLNGGSVTTNSGGSSLLGDVLATNGDINLKSATGLTTGSISAPRGSALLSNESGPLVTGAIAVSSDFTLNSGSDLDLGGISAGDDIRITTTGLARYGQLVSSGLGADGEGDGGNIVLRSTGTLFVDHAEAARGFTASAASISTGPNTIITGGDISLSAPGDIDLGNSQAGGFITANAGGVLSFGAMTSGASSSLVAGATLTGTSLTSGGSVSLRAGGAVTVNSLVASGTFAPAGIPAPEGNIFVISNGSAALGTLNARASIGVRANGVSGTGLWTAGEDIYVQSLNGATLAAVSAGDDVQIIAANGIALTDATARGTGRDDRNVQFNPAVLTPVGVFPANFSLVVAPAQGADIVLTTGASAPVNAMNLTAADDIAITGGAVTLTGLTRTTGAGLNGAGSDIDVTAASAALPDAQAFSALRVATSGAQTLGTLTAGSLIDLGSTNGNIDYAALTAGTSLALIAANGSVSGSGAANAGTDATLSGQSLAIGDVTAPGALSLTGTVGAASAGALSGGSVTASAGTALTAGQIIAATGDVTLSAVTGMTTGNITAMSGSALLSNTAGVLTTGIITVGNDFTLTTGSNVNLTGVTVGDDIRVTTTGTADFATLTALGGGIDNETDGRNIILTSTGAMFVGHAEASTNFTANAGRFETGPATIITGGDINISAPGDILLGNSRAGGFIAANAGGALNFGTISSGASTSLVAGTTLTGANLNAGGAISLRAGGNVTATNLVASGTYAPVPDANIFVISDGTASIRAMNANASIGVRANGVTSGGGWTAGEDIYVQSLGAVALNGLSSGDDIDILSANGIVLSGVTARGTARDDRAVQFNPGGGSVPAVPPSFSLVAATPAGSDINLTASATGPVTVTTLSAADDIAITGGAIRVTGSFRTLGQGLIGTGSDITITGASARLSRVAAFTDLRMTTSGNQDIFDGTAGGLAELISTNGSVGHNTLRAGTSVTMTAANGSVGGGDGVARAGTTLTILARDIAINEAIATGALNMTATAGAAQSGDLSGGSVSVSATDLLRAGNIQASAGSVTLAAINGLETGNITALAGSANLSNTNGLLSTGTIEVADDFTLATGSNVNLAGVTVGDDIRVTTTGTADFGNLFALGGGADNESDGANIILSSTGAMFVDHAEARDNFTATANRFETGPATIITGGHILINTAADILLGDSQAGLSITANSTGGAISFGTMSAGTTATLTAANTLTGTALTTADAASGVGSSGINIGTITAGPSVALLSNTNGVTLGAVTTTGDLDITANGINGLAAGILLADGHIGVDSNGPVSITSATARGTYIRPPANLPEGYIFINAAGPVTMGTANAATMLGVSGNGVTGTGNWTAGEDVLILSTGAANLSNVTAGDDLDARTAGNFSLNLGEATGLGRDDRSIAFTATASGSSFAITVPTAPNGADITLSSGAGNIQTAGLSAGDDIDVQASNGLASLGGLTRTRGIGTTGGASDIMIAANSGVFSDVDAFSNIRVNTTGASAYTSLRSGASTAVTAGTAITGGTGNIGTSFTLNGGTVNVGSSVSGGQTRITGTGGAIQTGNLTGSGVAVIALAGPVTTGDVTANSVSAFLSATGALNMGAVNAAVDITLSGTPQINFTTLTSGRDILVGDFLNASAMTGNAITAGRDFRLLGIGSFTVPTLSAGRAILLGGSNVNVGTIIAGTDALILTDQLATLGSVTAGDDIGILADGTGRFNVGTLTTTGLAGDVLNPLIFATSVKLDSVGNTIHVVGDDSISIGTINSAGSAVVGTRAAGTVTLGTTNVRDNLLIMAADAITAGAITAGGAVAITSADIRFDLTGGPVTGGLFGNYDLSTLGTIALPRSGGALTLTGPVNASSFRAVTGGNATMQNVTTTGLINVDSSAAIAAGALNAGTTLNLTGNQVDTAALSGSAVTVNSATTATTGALTTTAGNLLVRAANGITAGDTSVTGGNARFSSGGTLLLGNATVSGDLLAGEPLLGTPATNALTIGTVNAGGAAELYASRVTAGGVSAGTHVDINSLNSPAGGPISTGAINAGSYVEIRTANANVTTGNVVAGTDLAIDSIGAGSIVTTGNLTAGDDLLLGGATVVAGNLLSTGLGSDAAIGLPVNFGAAGPAGRVIRVSADTTGTLGTVATPDRVILYSANGSITAGNVSAPQAIMGFVRGNLSLGTIATAGHFYVADSSQYLPNAANLFSTYDPALLAALTPVRTSGSLTVGGPLSTGDVTIAVGSGTALPGLTQATRGVRIDAGGNLDVAGGVSAGTGILLNADGSIIAGNLLTLAGDIGATAATGISAGNATAPGSITLDTASGVLAFGTADAGNDLLLNAPGGAMTGILARAGDDLTISGASVVLPDVIARGLDGSSAVSISGTNGVTIQRTAITGTTNLSAPGGNILVAIDLASTGPVTALGRDVNLTALGPITLADATASANTVTVKSGGTLTANRLSARTALNLDSSGLIALNGAAVGETISLRSTDLAIGAGASLGEMGRTLTLGLRNTGPRQTHIGGTGGTGTYGLSNDEAQRLHAGSITLVAPRIGAAGGIAPASIRSRTPDVILDTLSLSAGSGATANIGSSGTLRIETPGKLKTIGAVTLGNLGNANRFELVASDMLEVDPATGSILMRDGSGGLAGTLSLQSDDVIGASSTAITDIINALTMKEISDRLGRNDGAVNDAGIFQANTLSVSVRNSFYIQNTGANSTNPRSFASRRGFTVGSGGLQINTLSPAARIAINGRQQDGLGGFITGLQFIPLARFNGGAAVSGLFDLESTINGCSILNPALCNVGLTATDVAKDTITRAKEQGEGSIIQISIIDLKGAEEVTDEPVIDEPVTGSANDDFWSIDDDREEEEAAAPAAP